MKCNSDLGIFHTDRSAISCALATLGETGPPRDFVVSTVALCDCAALASSPDCLLLRFGVLPGGWLGSFSEAQAKPLTLQRLWLPLSITLTTP